MYPFDCITDFIFVENKPTNVDVILVAGWSRPQLAEKAIELYKKGYAPYILISGGANAKLKDWETEFAYLKHIAISSGVPQDAILKEDQAKHTFDNANLSYKVLQNKNIQAHKVILVCKAHHSRRALLTYQTAFAIKTQFIICPIFDERNIRRDNRFLDQKRIDVVLKEVEKIGKYFGKHILHWVHSTKFTTNIH